MFGRGGIIGAPLLYLYRFFPYALRMPKSDRDFSLMAVGHHVRPSGRLWNPSADVYRSDEGWMVKVDLAGVCSDELEINVTERSLNIRGCRRDTFYREDYRYHQMEITYSRFEKTIQFPCAIESASVKHDYRDGFLIITLRCS
jgi:HSP20 family protein